MLNNQDAFYSELYSKFYYVDDRDGHAQFYNTGSFTLWVEHAHKINISTVRYLLKYRIGTSTI